MITMSAFLDLMLQTGIDDPNRFNGFLILGYVAMWLLAMVYIGITANRQRNLREEIRLMQELLTEDEEQQER
jgi:hypothetical protein